MTNHDTYSIEWLSEVDSTVILAKEYLNQAAKDASPKSFVAKTQTAGIGRMGRGWESLDGNLHLSLAVPSKFVSPSLRDLLPLVVAVVTADWCQRAYAITPIVKWPNDLFLSGKKIGGILCDATITGSEWNGVCIGLGLNLQKHPELSKQTYYQATSLKEMTGISVPASLAAEALVRQLCETLVNASREQILYRYKQLSTAEGQLWQDAEKKWWQQTGYSSDGHLKLKQTKAPFEELTLSSSEHSYLWQGLSCYSAQFVADIGNSRIKLGFAVRKDSQGSPEVQDFLAVPVSEIESLSPWIRAKKSLFENVPPVIHCSSVHHEAFEAFKSYAQSQGLTARLVRKDPLRNLSSVYELSQMGMDRFCLVEAGLAAKSRQTWAGGLLVVSLGTATTIDLIDQKGHHLGGYIGVGGETGLRALSERAYALPEIQAQNVTPEQLRGTIIPTTTHSAMAAAASRMQAAWIRGEFQDFKRRLKTNGQSDETEIIHLLLTGGLSPLVAPLLEDLSPVVQEDFVMTGVSELAFAGR